MVFSILKLASALALSASLASGAPTASAPVYPPATTSDNFRLVAKVTANDLTPSINNFVVSSYHVGAGEAYAVLVSDPTFGRIFYVNGTANDVRYRASNVLSDQGTPLAPAGVNINAPNAADQQTVTIDAGVGEAAIGVTDFPNPLSVLHGYYGEGEGFYACNNELPNGPAIQLLYKDLGDATPAGCADVTLVSQCSEGSGLEHPFGQAVGCYEDAASIDWTPYFLG